MLTEGEQAGSRPSPRSTTRNHYYKVIVSCPRLGFELGEHLLSKQLIVVFNRRPDLSFAGNLEAMGFDHTDDERMFTIAASPLSRKKASDLASEFSGTSRGRGR